MSYSGGAVIQCFDHNELVGSYSHYCCGFDYAGNKYSAWWPHIALFCPECGEIWGRRVYLYEFDYEPYQVAGDLKRADWAVETEHCAAHGGGQLLPDTLTEVADEPLLRREFDLLMQQFERS